MKTLSTLFILLLSFFSLTLFAQHKKAERIELLGETLFPEGILSLPSGDLLVGGFGDGSIQKIDKQNKATYFNAPGAQGMKITVGMAVDKKRNQLWVANFNFQTESGKPGSNLKVFDLASGKLLKSVPETFIEGVFFNEVAIDANGRVYVTNTFGPEIWTADYNSSRPEIFVKDDLLSNPAPDQPFDLNGLALTPDGRYLIASVMDRLDAGDGKLVRIRIQDKTVSPIQLQGGEAVQAFAGSDGMFFQGKQLIMVNVYSKAGALVSARFNPDFSTATLQVHRAFDGIADRPTASAVRGGKLYVVNSQLNHIIDDADGQLNTPHEKPFTVVALPLNEVLR